MNQTESSAIDTIRTRYTEAVARWGQAHAWNGMWADHDMSDVIDLDRQDETDAEAARTLCLIDGGDIRTDEVTQ